VCKLFNDDFDGVAAVGTADVHGGLDNPIQ
jgi:hypothetical protein